VNVVITNQGDPIAASLAPHVFDAWVSTRDASVAGGLGLWLSREMARDLGGDVELVPSDPTDAATTFQVRLPCAHTA
jgi:nitrogen-specific signal transduction histidine kinase